MKEGSFKPVKENGFEPVKKDGFLRPRCCDLVAQGQRPAVFNMCLHLIHVFLKQSLVMHPKLALNLGSSSISYD